LNIFLFFKENYGILIEIRRYMISMGILAEHFTWESYTPVFKQYYTMPTITDENEKMDTW
jgi:hypothetical protein